MSQKTRLGPLGRVGGEQTKAEQTIIGGGRVSSCKECHGFLGSFRQKTAERASEVQTAADSTGGEMGDPDPAS